MFLRVLAIAVFGATAACGSNSETAGSSAPAPPAASADAPAAAAPAEPGSQARGLMLALAQFVTSPDGKPTPGPARLEFLLQRGGVWQMSALEDPDGIVFHKAMVLEQGGEPRILTLAGSPPQGTAFLKLWSLTREGLRDSVLWKQNFGGKWSRMRDAEIADLYASGRRDIAVATHDQGVVAVLRAAEQGFEVVELDREPNTFVHEVEVGDLDGDGVPEVYATPSEPNRLDGSAQKGQVVRYVPARKEGRTVVADLGQRHAKEILVSDLDGDGREELYVAVEGHVEGDKLLEGVEIRRYEAGTRPDAGAVIARLDDRLTRFLTAGDLEGDGVRELVAASFSHGLWLYRPGADPGALWRSELIDADSAGFEHASILTDLDGDGRDELYVASDKHKELRRYVWAQGKLEREVIYKRPDERPIFTWNLMPVPASLVPSPAAPK